MAFTFEKLDNEPIVIITYSVEFDSSVLESINVKLDKLAEEIKPLYVISDLSQIEFSFTDLVMGLDTGTRGGKGSAGDERINHIIVGTQDMVKFAAQAAKQEQYGGLNIPIFETSKEALVHARGKVS